MIVLQERCDAPTALSEKGGADTEGPCRGISEKQIPHTARDKFQVKGRERVPLEDRGGRDDSVERALQGKLAKSRSLTPLAKCASGFGMTAWSGVTGDQPVHRKSRRAPRTCLRQAGSALRYRGADATRLRGVDGATIAKSYDYLALALYPRALLGIKLGLRSVP